MDLLCSNIYFLSSESSFSGMKTLVSLNDSYCQGENKFDL